MLDRYAVFGHPIGHSKSPRIHALFASETGQALEYTAQDVSPDSFDAAVRRFFAAGGKGLNCTLPFKEAAFRVAARYSARAQRAKAANVLALLEDGTIFAENTDGIGLVRDLTANLGLNLQDRSILLLGAGGACRGVLGALLELGPERLTIANRTPEKAVQLAAEFSDLGRITGGGFDMLAEHAGYDLILNATAASLTGKLPDLPPGILADGGSCYDLAYGNEPTAFVRWGARAGARLSVDGIGMLVEQAAETFLLWRGIRPETAPVIATLSAERETFRACK